MKPKGLVAAPSITSQTSMSMASHIRAISLTSPMFTLRKVFSSSLTVSATRTDETGTTVSITCEYRARGHLGAGGRHAADHLGDVHGVEVRVARIDALGREGQEEILAHLQAARPSRIGRMTSSVVPG